MPSLFQRGRTFAGPKGTAAQLCPTRLCMDHCDVDPHGSTVFPASALSPGTLGAKGNTFAPKCSQLGMEEWEAGKDDPQEGMG